MPQLIGAIDQGTTSTRFVIFDEQGSLVTHHQMELEQHSPQPGWMEHDPYDTLDSVRTCMLHAVHKLEGLGYTREDITCIGLTNQRETIVTWDKLTGQPLYPAILWSDARTLETVQQLTEKAGGNTHLLEPICGLPLTTYFTAVKLRWLLDNVPVIAQAQEQGRLCFGTMDTWLIYVSPLDLRNERFTHSSFSFLSHSRI